jgi:hypothetical protein
MNLTTDNNKVELTVNPTAEAYFKEVFEIEMLQGLRKLLSNGQIYYEFEISDEKMKPLKQWWLDYLKKDLPKTDN